MNFFTGRVLGVVVALIASQGHSSVLEVSVRAEAHAALLAEDLIENDAYTTWAKFKPGTVVTQREVEECWGHYETTWTRTLAEVGADKVIVKVTGAGTLDGKVREIPPFVEEIPAKIAKVTPSEFAKTETKTQDVVVGEKTYSAKYTKTVVTANEDSKVTTVTLTSFDVPGSVLRRDRAEVGSRTKQCSSRLETTEITPAK